MGSCQSVSGAESKSESRQKGKPQLLIKSFTWSRDSHGLFDYESKTLIKKTIKSGNGGKLTRNNLNEINFSKDDDQPVNTTEKDLVQLTIREGNYWVAPTRDHNAKKTEEHNDHEDHENNMWMVVKSFKSTGVSRNGCKLSEGDLLKLGRIKFRVKEFRCHSAAAQAAADKRASIEKNEKHNTKIDDDLSAEESPKRNSKGFSDSKESIAQTCRICLGEGGEVDDPFFSPCRCTGTMRYIHVQCLQKWLRSKLHVKNTNFSQSIQWKTLECELCKTTYQSSYIIEGKKHDIVEVERPECGYLMLEILSKEKNVTRGIHIIKMEGKTNIRLGRGHDSDIRISDISVSRCHAIIRLEKGNFYIEDNASKFGTLMHMRKPFALFGDYNNISLQLGRTVVTLSVKKNWKSLQTCFGGDNIKNPIEMEYEDMFDKAPATNYQHSEAAPIRTSNQIDNQEHQPGSFEEDDDHHNQNDIVPHQAGNGNEEPEDIVDLDNAELSEEEDLGQQMAEAPENLAQSQAAQLPVEQNINTAIVVQNMIVNANPNHASGLVQSQAIAQTN